jgi:hypothetical protein
MEEIMIENYKINTNLLEMKLSDLQNRGAECIADVDHVELLINLRHMYLSIAKDFCVNHVNPIEIVMGEAYCELAEKMQDLLELCWQ